MPDMNVALSWGSRYMAWMTLGGTLKMIPQDIIHLVEATKIFGETRQNLQFLPGANQTTANMLNLARGLCSVVLPEPTPTGHFGQDQYLLFKGGLEPQVYPPFNSDDAPFITVNEDKEMWLTLCTGFSPPVVRVYAAGPVNRGRQLRRESEVALLRRRVSGRCARARSQSGSCRWACTPTTPTPRIRSTTTRPV